jgi:hypothetical protein
MTVRLSRIDSELNRAHARTRRFFLTLSAEVVIASVGLFVHSRMPDGLNRHGSSWRRSGSPNRNRRLCLPLESTWLLFLGLRLCGLSSGIVEDFRLGAKPILVRFPAVCSPNVISTLTNAKHQSLIHRRPTATQSTFGLG